VTGFVGNEEQVQQQKEGAWLLQVTETEIDLPFSSKYSLPHGNTLQTSIAGVIPLGAGILFLILQVELLLSIVLIAAGFLLLLSPLIIAWTSKRISRQFVRMNHEGVFFASLLPTVVQWGDISTVALSTWTSMGHPINSLSFVPRDPEAMIARIIEHRTKHIFSRLLMKTNVLFYRRSHAPSPLMISQAVSPIPLDELLTLIQERFANELRENRVTVLGWQESGT